MHLSILSSSPLKKPTRNIEPGIIHGKIRCSKSLATQVFDQSYHNIKVIQV